MRRTEIITLGSLPFTVLWVSLSYETYNYVTGVSSTFQNPFGSNDYSESDIAKIVGISFGASVAIGLVDLIITLVKQKKEKDYTQKTKEVMERIKITSSPPEENFPPPDIEVNNEEK